MVELSFVLCYVALSSPDGITDGTVDSRQLLEKVMPRMKLKDAYHSPDHVPCPLS